MHIQVKMGMQKMRKNPAPLNLNGTGYCASLNFRRTARAVTRLYDMALQESGIRSTQFAILVGIAKSQPVSVGALGDVLGIDSTTLTRSLKPLERDRLVAVSNRAAMRQRFLTITAKGEHTLGRSLPAWRAAQERFVATIGPDYWVELQIELERLAHLAIGLEKQRKETLATEAIVSLRRPQELPVSHF
jgi:DNA-binding MarR family transcriptional regulator